MTCTMMLDAMLEAELDELRLDVDTPLSRHLRTCARCRVVAGRLALDTDALARLVTPVRVEPHEQHERRTRVRAWRLQAAALAAVAAGVVIVLRAPRPASAPAGASGPSPSPLVMQPVRVTPFMSALPRRTHPAIRTARPAPHRDLGPAIVVATVEVAPTPAIRAERAVAVAPVRLEVGPRSSLGGGVAVDPPPGRRATIIPTDQPGVTVVWLHR